MVSAGSKMQAHLFAWSNESKQLRHLCKYNQQVFKKKDKTGKKEFGVQTDGQDFRIMAVELQRMLNGDFFLILGSSSGHLILCQLLFD